MVGSVDIGDKRVWFTAYNPSDELSKMYCVMIVDMVMELLENMSQEDAHAWLRERYPDTAPYLDLVESGREPIRETPIGEYPVRPGAEALDKQIISFLKKRKARLLG